MASIQVSRTYAAPKDKVFAIFADIGNVSEISPGIKASKRLNEIAGLGGARECDFGGDAGIHEEVTAFVPDEKIQFTGVKIWGVPMKTMVATFDFNETGGGTTITMNMDFQAKYRILNPFMGMMNKKAIGAMLKGAESKL